MFPATSNGGGQCAGFPDVCKTLVGPSVIPLPYPNIAMCNQAKGSTCSKRVKIINKKAMTTKSEISMSSGDEAGCAGGGVVSSKFKGPAKYKKGSGKVKVEGSPMVHLTSMIGLNGGANANCPAGVQVAPSQTKVCCAP